MVKTKACENVPSSLEWLFVRQKFYKAKLKGRTTVSQSLEVETPSIRFLCMLKQCFSTLDKKYLFHGWLYNYNVYAFVSAKMGK